MEKWIKTMNIYQKLQNARVELQEMKLKKTGKNQSMTYYELGDLLPAVNVLCQKHELFTNLSIVHKEVEMAVLTVYNSLDAKESIVFECPTAEAQLPKGQAIQNLGAKITYLRRYMLMTAFEIAESDIVDQVRISITDEIEAEDIKTIEDCKTETRLNEVYSIMSKKYKMTLIQPIFSKVKTAIQQNESKL